MLDVAAFKDEMNLLAGKGFVPLLEILYDKSDPSPANWLYFRVCKYTSNITFAMPQLGNPTVTMITTFTPFSMSDFELTQSTDGQIPGFQLVIENVGREMMSIVEFYEIERARGRIVIVHPNKLADSTARIEERFRIHSATASDASCTLECVGVNFDPLLVMIPSRLVTREEFPSIPGNDGRFVGGLAA